MIEIDLDPHKLLIETLNRKAFQVIHQCIEEFVKCDLRNLYDEKDLWKASFQRGNKSKMLDHVKYSFDPEKEFNLEIFERSMRDENTLIDDLSTEDLLLMIRFIFACGFDHDKFLPYMWFGLENVSNVICTYCFWYVQMIDFDEIEEWYKCIRDENNSKSTRSKKQKTAH